MWIDRSCYRRKIVAGVAVGLVAHRFATVVSLMVRGFVYVTPSTLR